MSSEIASSVKVLVPQTYEVLRTLPEAGMSKVQVLENKLLPRLEVRKTIDLLDLPDAVPFQEPQLLERIKHPNVVHVYDAHYDRTSGVTGRITFNMPYYPEGSVQDVLLKGRRFSVGHAVRLLVDLLDALSYVHEELGYLHRDLKVSNALLDGGGAKALLSDFGVAARMREDGTVQALIGTPLYRPPEFNNGRLFRASDLYCMGLALREMLGGNFDYARLNDVPRVLKRLEKRRYAIPEEEFIPPPFTPPHLRRVLAKSIRRRPEQRYQSASEMTSALLKEPYIDWSAASDAWEGTDNLGRRYRVTARSVSGGRRVLSAARQIEAGAYRRIPGIKDTPPITAGDRAAHQELFDAIDAHVFQR